MTYEQIEVTPVAGALGAEVRGIDLSRPLGNRLYHEVHEALIAHQVIFFRDQDITPAEHIAFARHFGTLHVHPYAKNLEDHPEVLVLKSSKENRNAANTWHSDVTFQAEPPLGSILLAREVPAYGGDTMWASMYAAYEALSAPMKRYLEGMTALHSTGRAQFEKTHERLDDRERESIRAQSRGVEEIEHPAVRTHPITGRKALFVNSLFTQRLRGVTRRESQAVLAYLFEHLKQPELTCRFRWEKGSVAFWDNRCTQHYAIADYGDATRIMHRVTINGDRPV